MESQGWRRAEKAKCSLEQTSTFKTQLPTAAVQQPGSHLIRIFYIPLQAAAHCFLSIALYNAQLLKADELKSEPSQTSRQI